jgi:hypothetical protein
VQTLTASSLACLAVLPWYCCYYCCYLCCCCCCYCCPVCGPLALPSSSPAEAASNAIQCPVHDSLVSLAKPSRYSTWLCQACAEQCGGGRQQHMSGGAQGCQLLPALLGEQGVCITVCHKLLTTHMVSCITPPVTTMSTSLLLYTPHHPTCHHNVYITVPGGQSSHKTAKGLNPDVRCVLKRAFGSSSDAVECVWVAA